MRNFLFAFIFMGLAMYLGYELYERGEVSNWFGSEAKDGGTSQFQFPDEIEIVREDGSRLDVLLTARNATHIQFERLSDGAAFTFEIAQLSAATRKRIMEYPHSGLKVAGAPVRSEELSMDDIYLEQLRKAVSEIDAKLVELERRYKVTKSHTERRTLFRESEDLNREKTELRAKIVERTGG